MSFINVYPRVTYRSARIHITMLQKLLPFSIATKMAWKQGLGIFSGLKGYLYTDNVLLFVPNIIDYIRVMLLASFAYNAALGNFSTACVSYAISVALDELDGNCARYLGQTSLFGMMFDILVDEASVLCLCTVLSTIYPKYIVVFQLYSLLDIAGQWTNYQYAAMYKNNDYTRFNDLILNVYFNKKVLTNLWVYGNHVFLLMLYLSSFTCGPEIDICGYKTGLWKLLAYISAPWSVSRLFIMVYLMLTSLYNMALQDRLNRGRNQNLLNGATPNGGGLILYDRDSKED